MKYLLIIFLLLGTWKNAICQVNIDSLKNIIRYQTGKERVRSLYNLSYALTYSNTPEALRYGRLALEEAFAIQDSLWVSGILIELSDIYQYQNDYGTALNYLDRAKEIAERKDYYSTKVSSYTGLATLYLNLNIYDKALKYNHLALKLKEQNKDDKTLAITYNNIGLIFYRINDSEKAQEYFQKALAAKLANGDSAGTASTYANLGWVHIETGNDQEALGYFYKGLKIVKKYNEHHNAGLIYNGLANVYTRTNNFDSANFYLKLSMKLEEKGGNDKLKAVNYFQFAKLYSQKGRYAEAIEYLHRSQLLAKNASDKVLQKNNLKLLSDIYELKNEYDSAYRFQKEYSALESSIFNEKLAKNLANIQIDLQEEQNKQIINAQEQKITKNRQFSFFLLSILGLSVTLIIVIFSNYRHTHRINKILNESKSEIEKQKEDLERKNEQLAKAQDTINAQNSILKNVNIELEGKVKERTLELEKSNTHLEKAVHDLDQFIYKTSHDLRGPIATMQGIINLGDLEAKDQKSQFYFQTLKKVSVNLNNVLTRLIDVHETYQKLPVFVELDPAKEIKRITETVTKFVDDPSVTVIIDLHADGKWVSDKLLFEVVIENLVRNAFIYSDKPKSIIKIHSEYQNKMLFITVEDNGFGIQPGDEDKVFNIFFKGSPKPGGTGLELYSTKIAAEKLGGKLTLLKPANNTIFEIQLPPLQLS